MYSIGILVIGAIAAIAFLVSFWIELLIAGIFIKNLNSKYLAVALFNVVPALLSLGTGPAKFLTFLCVGAPILALMYWQARRAALKRPA
jgi:hypothetical protein